MDGWIKLSDMEYKNTWRIFKKKYSFRPSTHENEWPGIKEPAPSITYDISHFFKLKDKIDAINDLHKKVLNAFKAILNRGDLIYALDWQHSCYKFDPRIINIENWKIPALPNGDYYIFLTNNLMNGLFGHPWEGTICIFRQALIDEISNDSPIIFDKIMRKKV